MLRKFAILTALLLPGLALAQTYPAPKFDHVILNGSGSTGDASSLTVLGAGAATPETLAAMLAQIATPQQYGAPANTQRAQAYGVTSTAGSASATVALTFSPSDVGKNIVIAGLGPNVAQSAAIASGGSGNAVGDLLTLAGGTCATRPVLKVVAVISGAVTVAVPVTPGSCFALPPIPAAVASTTDCGSGATFTLTGGALPLQTTISAVFQAKS